MLVLRAGGVPWDHSVRKVDAGGRKELRVSESGVQGQVLGVLKCQDVEGSHKVDVQEPSQCLEQQVHKTL